MIWITDKLTDLTQNIYEIQNMDIFLVQHYVPCMILLYFFVKPSKYLSPNNRANLSASRLNMVKMKSGAKM